MSTNPQVYGCGAEPSTEERYLKAPILTLLASLEDDERSIISLHDVMDAYYTFCGRVKRISDVLSRSPSNVAALRFVEQHSVSIVKCLRRDVRRALVEPLLPASQDVFADYHVRFDKPRRRDEDMKIATDTVSICLTALRTVSYVLRVPALSQVFAADDLVQLANDVLDIIEFPLLPIPSDKKVRTLAVWVLSNGHFPVASVASRRTQLMRILNETILYSEDTFVIPNYLRALGSLLHAHSSIFLESCTLIFPPVIKRLSSDVDHIRTEAVYALSGFAFAVVSHDQDTRRMSVGPLRRPLQNSIDAADGKQASPSSKTRNLVTTVMALLGSGDKPAPTQHVVRAQVILASAIAISGAEIFTHKASLKLVLKVSAETARHNRRSVRIVHALVWRCLVWAFAELQRESDAGNTQKPLRKIRNSVLEVIKQERRDGIGAALISTLLGSPLTHGDPLAKQKNVGEAIAVLRSMAEDSANVRAEARAILSRLTSAIGSAPTPPSTPATEGRSLGEGIIVKELLDGTIQRMSEEQLAKALPELTQFSVEGIRPLMEAEIVASWDKLVESWMALVKKDVLGSQGVFSAPHDLLGPWQALLLVLAQLTQEHRHLTASAECAHKVANICCDILAWQGNPTTKPIDETALRVNQLRFVLMLWKVARNVFNASWLASAAEPILRAVLQRTYDLTKKEIADAWAELSGALVLSGSHDLLHRLAVHDEARQEMELKRHLWSVLAKSWCFSEAKPDWKVTVSLVTLPIGVFALCEDDVGLWEELLRATIASAGSVDTPSDRVLETIAARFDEQSERCVLLRERACLVSLTFSSTSRHSRLVIPLLTHLKMDHDDMIPRDFLHLIDVFLCELYASKQEELYPALQTIRILSTLVQSCPQPAIVSLVSAVSDGLCIWIHDEEEFVPGQQYNDVIMPLYQATLNRLAGYSFTAESLGAIAPFLASTFKRIVHPAHGPTAFADFWNSVRHTLTLQSTAIHEDLKQALKINHDYFGGDLPSDVSYDSQSQTQSQSQEEVCPRISVRSPVY
ncbi:uncharacterized protein C8Q71DRAFT_700943 [Rhodofomes roseus]|uniref:Telomere-associated protein Rif1 N-terminal domain-containing protein n=1 Tax=Rhodofomes roseus TaxID=34475 RepID=A0ABQ8KSM4_9APHY|nr:uncharacterized protein C8Q71DRAFT_700943 [Rhodofomes roseus]KAH9841456.1 hypothetical protein C8Q71DRAFT_700943 [Rhodofomes roseus]